MGWNEFINIYLCSQDLSRRDIFSEKKHLWSQVRGVISLKQPIWDVSWRCYLKNASRVDPFSIILRNTSGLQPVGLFLN